MLSNKDAAVAIAAVGITVFPCGPDKKPRGPWKDVAIRPAWQVGMNWNDADLPAIPVGKHSWVVIDADVAKPNRPDGRAAFTDLCKREGVDLSNACVVTTPSGGLHFYFHSNASYGNSPGALPAGIDVRGRGGYVIGPGAALPDGRTYRHDHGSFDAVPPLPEALAKYLRAKDGVPDSLGASAATSDALIPAATGASEPEGAGEVLPIQHTDSDRAYASGALASACEIIRNAKEGGRNTTLNNQALGIAEIAANSPDELQAIGQALKDAATSAGLGEDEADATIRSAFLAGLKKRRPLPSERASSMPLDGLFASAMTTNQAKTTNQDVKKRGITIMQGIDVTEQPVTWLWQNWIPKGKLTLLAGAGGTGKSTLAFSFSATVSSGGVWPDGTLCNQRGNVLIWSSEDDPADTIKPRLMAMKADQHQIGIITGVLNDRGEREAFDPARDMESLREAVNRIGGVKLFIIDPIVTAVAGDMHKANDVRRSLQPIVDFAAEMDCAVLGITHFAKNTQGKRSDERVIGSVAFKDFARMVLTAARDEETNLRAFTRPKSNISVDEGGFLYTIEPVMVTDTIQATRIQWGDFVQGSARSILADIEGDDTQPVNKSKRQGPRDHAKDFVRDFLTRGPLPIQLVKDAAAQAGHAPATLQRAVATMDLVNVRDQVTKQMLWQLPEQFNKQIFAPPLPKL